MSDRTNHWNEGFSPCRFVDVRVQKNTALVVTVKLSNQRVHGWYKYPYNKKPSSARSYEKISCLNSLSTGARGFKWSSAPISKKRFILAIGGFVDIRDGLLWNYSTHFSKQQATNPKHVFYMYSTNLFSTHPCEGKLLVGCRLAYLQGEIYKLPNLVLVKDH